MQGDAPRFLRLLVASPCISLGASDAIPPTSETHLMHHHHPRLCLVPRLLPLRRAAHEGNIIGGKCALGRWGAAFAPLSLGRWLPLCAMPLPARFRWAGSPTLWWAFAAEARSPGVLPEWLWLLLDGGRVPRLGRPVGWPPFVYHAARTSRPRRARLGSIRVVTLSQDDNAPYRLPSARRLPVADASVALWVSLAPLRLPPHVCCCGGLRPAAGTARGSGVQERLWGSAVGLSASGTHTA